MVKDEILEKLRELNQNLQVDCCQIEITPLLKRLKLNVEPHVKLYGRFCDACEENGNFEWYLLSEIHRLNILQARRNGIKCHDCEKECNVKNKSCSISLIIDDIGNTRFGLINKLEIIYF
jgi:hypothetical protein